MAIMNSGMQYGRPQQMQVPGMPKPVGVPNMPAIKPPQANAGMGPQPIPGKPPQMGQQAMPNGPVQPLQGNTNGQLPGGMAQMGGGVPLQLQQHRTQSNTPLPGKPFGYGQPAPPPNTNQRMVSAGGGEQYLSNGNQPPIGPTLQAPQQNYQPPQQQAQPMYPGQPTITTGGIYSQQQQDQLINQALGQNSMQADSANIQMMDRLGGAGFAAGGSPKAMALQNQIRAAQMGADNAARTGIPLQLAGQNAQHLLASQNAAENQYSNRQNERLTGQGQNLGFLSNLLGNILSY